MATNINSDHADTSGLERMVLVFAPSERDPAYQEQMLQLQGLGEVLEAHGLSAGQCFWEGTCYIGEHKLTADEADALRRRLNVDARRFRILVVGADGAVRLHEDAPVKQEVIRDALGAPAETARPRH